MGFFFFSNTQQATVLLWQFKNVTPDSSQAFLWAALRGWTNLDGESKVIVESLNNCPLKGPSGGSFPVGRGSHVRSHCHTMASKCSRLAPVTVRVPDGEAWAGALFFFFFFYLTHVGDTARRRVRWSHVAEERLKGALCRFGEEIQAQSFHICNIDEENRNMYFFL